MHLNASANIFARAEGLRAVETKAEKLLWAKLCKSQLGVKFRRQHPIHTYIADFYCHPHRLVVELDGPIHQTQESKLRDKLRTEELGRFGITVLRFENKEVFTDCDAVVQTILREMAKPKTSMEEFPSLPPQDK